MNLQDLSPAEVPANESIEAGIRAARAAVQSAEALCKDAFLPLLREHGFTRIEIDYDGGGDEGSVCDVNAYTAEGSADLPGILCDHHSLEYGGDVRNWTIDIEDALSRFAENAICARHCGWENGEGAYGTVAIDVASGAVTLIHNARFVDYETTETEF